MGRAAQGVEVSGDAEMLKKLKEWKKKRGPLGTAGLLWAWSGDVGLKGLREETRGVKSALKPRLRSQVWLRTREGTKGAGRFEAL